MRNKLAPVVVPPPSKSSSSPASLHAAFLGGALGLLALSVAIPIALLSTSRFDAEQLIFNINSHLIPTLTQLRALIRIILHPDVLYWTGIGLIFVVFWSCYGVAVVVLPFSLLGAGIFAFAIPAIIPFFLPADRTGVRALMQGLCFFLADIEQEWQDIGIAEGIITTNNSNPSNSSEKITASTALRKRKKSLASSSERTSTVARNAKGSQDQQLDDLIITYSPKQTNSRPLTSGNTRFQIASSPKIRRVLRLIRRLFLRPYLWRHLEAHFPDHRISIVSPRGSQHNINLTPKVPRPSPQSSLHNLRTGVDPPYISTSVASAPVRGPTRGMGLPSPTSSRLFAGETSLLAHTLSSMSAVDVEGPPSAQRGNSDTWSLWSADSEEDSDRAIYTLPGTRGGRGAMEGEKEDIDHEDRYGNNVTKGEQESTRLNGGGGHTIASGKAKNLSPVDKQERELVQSLDEIDVNWDSVEWRLRQIYTYFNLRHETVPSPYPTVYLTLSNNFAFVTEMILGIMLVTLFAVSHDSIRHGLWPFLSKFLPYPVAVAAFYMVRWTLNQAMLLSSFAVLDGAAGLVCIASNRLPIYPVHDSVESAGSLTAPVSTILGQWPFSSFVPAKIRKIIAVWSTFAASAGFHAWIIVVGAWDQPYMREDAVKMFLFFILQPILMFVEPFLGINTWDGNGSRSRTPQNATDSGAAPVPKSKAKNKPTGANELSDKSSTETDTSTTDVSGDGDGERSPPVEPGYQHQDGALSRKKVPHWIGVVWTTVSIWLLSGPLVVEPVLHLMGV
ncbi:hypothetical protein HDU93_000128 [Gonapodya sp. JEL0774]|nr:hypothetical protein HDU93_000128 [Gonapodya sp. JEL0774]